MSAASRRIERTDETHETPPGEARGSMWLIPALLLGALFIVMAANAHAALYKWTDANGHVHYSDKLPADAVNDASYQLNRQGMTIRKVEQARPVAKPKDASEAQREKDAERERMLAQRRDRALIESYSNESEIDLAKKRALATIDGQMQSAQAFIAQMGKRRDELESKKTTFAPRPVPGSIEREIETIDAEVVRQNEFIASKQKESATVAARYDSDKQRFRELRGEPAGSVVTTDDGQHSSSRIAGIELTSAQPAKK